MNQLLRTKEELKQEFEEAQKGIDQKTVNKVMKGRHFDGDNTSEIRALKAAWAPYHTAMRV